MPETADLAERPPVPATEGGPFAPGAGVACVILRAEGPLPPLREAERALTERMVPARLREFAFGRHAARQALARLGATAGPILPDADRVPVWPVGITGSISHSGPFCAAAVRRGPGSLGLDIEAEGALAPDLWDAVLTGAELRALEALPAAARPAAALARFTAKEAVYKAHFPLHRTMFEFSDLEIAPAQGGFAATFRGRAGSAWAPVRGHWMRGPGWTASGVLLSGRRAVT